MSPGRQISSSEFSQVAEALGSAAWEKSDVGGPYAKAWDAVIDGICDPVAEEYLLVYVQDQLRE